MRRRAGSRGCCATAGARPRRRLRRRAGVDAAVVATL